MLEKFSFNAEPGKPTIVMTQLFDAPRNLVFEAWTKAEHVARWWDPSGAPLSICEIDLRPNGAFRWVNRSPNGKEHSFSGTYREISAPERLVWASPSPESIATLVFSEVAGATKLTMTIECKSIEDRNALLKRRMDVGTAQTLKNLTQYLTKMV